MGIRIYEFPGILLNLNCFNNNDTQDDTQDDIQDDTQDDTQSITQGSAYDEVAARSAVRICPGIQRYVFSGR